ncbi:MAG: ATP-binding cassette domain-containing protein [Hyphomicrobiaceae bacterium]
MANSANHTDADQALASRLLAAGAWLRLSAPAAEANGWVPEQLATIRSYMSEIPVPVVISSLVINVLGLALPIVILQVYDRVLVNEALGTLFWLLTGLAVVVVAEAALKVMRSHLMFWTAAQNAFQSDASTVARLLNAPNARVRDDAVSAWIDRLDALDQVNGFKASNSRLALLDVPFIVIYLAAIYLVAGALVFAIIAVVSLLAVYAYVQARALRKILRERGQLDRQRFSFLAETFQYISPITSSAMEPQLERRFEQLQRSAVGTIFRKNLLANDLTAATSLVTNVVLVVVVTAGALLVIHDGLSVGTLACATMLTSRLIQPIVRGIPALLEIETAQLAEQRAQVLRELPRDTTARKGAQPIKFGEIKLTDMTLTYEGSRQPAIDIPGLIIGHGQIIGIKGGHSGGKSTLLKLLRGELSATTGTIEIAAQDILGPRRADVLARIRYVGPDPEVFEGTLLQNIIMHRPGDAIEIGRRAAQLIGLEQAINRLPKGFDTPLGDGSADVLPAGMLQQISIARALAGEPQVLLFDEANSRLDMRADAALRAGLERVRGRITCILVSNRPSLLAIADRVFELRQGKLLEAQPARGSRSDPPRKS